MHNNMKIKEGNIICGMIYKLIIIKKSQIGKHHEPPIVITIQKKTRIIHHNNPQNKPGQPDQQTQKHVISKPVLR